MGNARARSSAIHRELLEDIEYLAGQSEDEVDEVPWQATSLREIEWLEKQRKIEKILADFRANIPSVAEDVPYQIRAIFRCVHQHLFDVQMNVNWVRHRCGWRNKNISSRFRRISGVGLRDYIELGRIEAAKRLLLHHDLEIYLIATAVGYEHQETFSRAFQRQVGKLPSDWREQYSEVEEYPEFRSGGRV